MITDQQTNKLLLADTLPVQYPVFFKNFEQVLKNCGICFQLLPETKDIWAVDYMPIQVAQNKFVRFTYNPKYLQSKKYLKTISDVDAICEKIGIQTIQSSIVLDGGNVTRCSDKVIMTDRIFEENPTIEAKQLTKELEELFEVERIFFVPEQPGDFTGHSDGMVRFVDDNTVIINDYKGEKEEFRRAFKIAIHNTGLNYIEIPYHPSDNFNFATGDYINYLQMEKTIIVPTFSAKEDEPVIRKFEEIFKGQNIATIESTEIAEQGGILNCITWNIKQ